MPQNVTECECRSRQNADESVTHGELSTPRLLLVVGVGIVALILRSYGAPPDFEPATGSPVTAAAAAPVVAVPVPLVGASTSESREDGARKRTGNKKRGAHNSARGETRRRASVSPGFRFR